MKICDQFAAEDGLRLSILEEARLCAALTKPWILPPENQNPDMKLPENYQSEGSRGITNMEGRMLMALYPPDAPWFRLEVAPKYRYSGSLNDRQLQEIQQKLFIQELVIQAALESVHLNPRSNGIAAGFRSNKRLSISHVLITGDVLERLDDNYRLTVFRRDQYVTLRDSAGAVMHHIIKERIDPLNLTDEQITKSKLDKEKLKAEQCADRMRDMYTLVEWQPWSKNWVVRQEINDEIIVESQEPISPYFSTSYELVSGENYGRGWIAQNLGDLRSLNTINEKMLDFAAMASKFLTFLDSNSEIQPKQLEEKSGSVIHGRVAGGQVQDVAFLKTDKFADFRVVFETAERIRKSLGSAMLMESAVQPTGDRVTATQVQRVALELEGALGGIYAPIADEQQIPLLQRTRYQLQRDKLIAPLPEGFVEIKGLTGISALSREHDAARVMEITAIVAQLPEEARARIDYTVLVDVLARYRRIDVPGLIKSPEQVISEHQQMMQQQAAMAANEKAIDVIGNVAEQALTPGQ